MFGTNIIDSNLRQTTVKKLAEKNLKTTDDLMKVSEFELFKMSFGVREREDIKEFLTEKGLNLKPDP